MALTSTLVLHTPRLLLRPFALTDAPALYTLINRWEIAYNTLNIPHPYPQGLAENYILATNDKWMTAENLAFAVLCDATLVGCVNLSVRHSQSRAELGYWIGVPYWGQGYATEAAGRLMQFGFEKMKLHRVYATCFSRNIASAKVLQKIGMRYEGTLRGHYHRWNEYLDAEYYGILRDEFDSMADSGIKKPAL
jgi:RimJ/RimL family protein N-acetyltransferase